MKTRTGTSRRSRIVRLIKHPAAREATRCVIACAIAVAQPLNTPRPKPDCCR